MRSEVHVLVCCLIVTSCSRPPTRPIASGGSAIAATVPLDAAIDAEEPVPTPPPPRTSHWVRANFDWSAGRARLAENRKAPPKAGCDDGRPHRQQDDECYPSVVELAARGIVKNETVDGFRLALDVGRTDGVTNQYRAAVLASDGRRVSKYARVDEVSAHACWVLVENTEAVRQSALHVLVTSAPSDGP